MSMAIASDADETSTGSSGNPVENEDTNMLADSSGSNQLDCTVHHYYEKLKDFAFDMPGGWTDPTISLFIDTFKQYKDDFSRPHPDELKIWQKIVKRCVERSNNHKVFTVNSVMELAGSLKSHVLRNKYRKDDETFKMLCNDVVDIIPYFPNTTCDSVSQNLRLRSRSAVQEIKTFSGAGDVSPSKNANIDNLIIKYCEEMNLKSERYCSNVNWNKISKQIIGNHGLRVDVKKHLGELKRKLAKDLKGETDPIKRKTVFLETVGLYQPYFDLMPPRTIKTEDFIKENMFTVSNGVESSSDDPMETDEVEATTSNGQKTSRRGKTKVIRPVDSFPKIKKMLANEYEDSSESDEPARRQRISPKKTSLTQPEDTSSDSVTSPEANSNSVDGRGNVKVTNRKQPSPKKRINMITLSANTSKGISLGRGRRGIHSSDDESSSDRGKSLKRPVTDTLESSSASPQKSVTVGPHNSKNAKISNSDRSTVASNKPKQAVTMKTQAKIELAPLKVQGSTVPNIDSNLKGAKKSENAKTVEMSVDRRNKKVNFDSISADSGNKVSVESVEINSSSVEDPQPEAKGSSGLSSSGSAEKVKSNIVTPINVKVSEQVRQEAPAATNTATNSDSSAFAKPDTAMQPLSTNSVSQDFNRLERMEENTVRIIEGYKEKVKDAGHSVMQLIPKQHSHMIQPVGVANTSAPDTDYTVQSLSMGKPPGWFDAFLTDYKKHEMWKMHQLLKMQQELVDMENRKLNVLEKILTSLNDRKS